MSHEHSIKIIKYTPDILDCFFNWQIHSSKYSHTIAFVKVHFLKIICNTIWGRNVTTTPIIDKKFRVTVKVKLTNIFILMQNNVLTIFKV